MKIARFIAVLSILLILSGTAMAEATPMLFSPDLWGHLDGSTSLIPLSEALLSHLTGITSEEAAKKVVHHTTSEAYGALLRDETDIRLIFVTPPSADELHSATLNGIALELVPIACEALVLLVNDDNPVTNLSTEQLQGIYQGKITNWSEVGGTDLPIIPYQRSLNSGSQTLFRQLLMKGLDPMEPPKELTITSMSFLVDAVSAYDNSEGALGYSVYY